MEVDDALGGEIGHGNGRFLIETAHVRAEQDVRIVQQLALQRQRLRLENVEGRAEQVAAVESFAEGVFIDERPAALRSGARASGYDASAGTLFVDNRDKRRDARFALPIAAAQIVASK